MIRGVHHNLALASENADRLARYLCLAGTAEPASELAMKLVKMSDDARTLAGALERMSLRDTDAKYRERIEVEHEKAIVQAERDRERAKARYAQKKAERMEAETQRLEAAIRVAAEASAGAAEQATASPYFFNWATVPHET